MITNARITAMPQSFLDPMPKVIVQEEDGIDVELFEYYPDEITFFEEEFIGLTIEEARHLKFIKDKQYLQS